MIRPALLALALAAPAAGLAATPTLPSGTYSIAGAFSAYSGGACIIGNTAPITGVLSYPGAGNTQYGTSLVLQSASGKAGVAAQVFTAFPPPPATGLNGWTASPNYNAYLNGVLENGGAGATVTFSVMTIFASPQAFGQASIRIVGPGCSETLRANLDRIGGFQK